MNQVRYSGNELSRYIPRSPSYAWESEDRVVPVLN